jgi:ElaB/YqjD/DUF883 family membrane-anchored ribosome-binding protein
MKKPTSFEEAYRMLDQAIIELDEPRLKPLVLDEYNHIRNDVRENLTERAHQIQREGKQLALVAQDLTVLGWGHVEELAAKVDEDVRQNPLLYIGGAAAAALAIGIILSPRRTEVRV